MSQRLSCHVQEWTPGALEFCLRLGGPVIKTMSPTVEPIAKILEAHPKTQIIVRKYYSLEEQADILSRGAAGGVQVVDDVAHMFKDIEHLCVDRGVDLWFEGLNEVGLWNDAANYNAFTVAFAARCNEWMVNPLAYSFPVGNPPEFEHWKHYLDGLRACMKYGGGLALHQYGWPDVRHDADWLSCRHRKVREVLPDDLKNIPILVTETGLDRGVGPERKPDGIRPEDWAGWTQAGIDPDEYAEQLVWLDAQYNADDVKCGTIFTVGGFWPSFDVAHVPEIADALREAAKSHPVSQPVTPDVPVPSGSQTPFDGDVTEPMKEWTRDAIIALIIAYADAAGVPRRLALGCGIAESNLRQYAERLGVWPDVSFGIGQQIVLYAPVGNGKDTPENRALVRDWLFDPNNAVPLMVGKLAQAYDDRIKAGYDPKEAEWQALYRYNTGGWAPPSGQYAGNVENYRRALAQADVLLARWAPQESESVDTQAKANISIQVGAIWGLAQLLRKLKHTSIAEQLEAAATAVKDAAGIP